MTVPLSCERSQPSEPPPAVQVDTSVAKAVQTPQRPQAPELILSDDLDRSAARVLDALLKLETAKDVTCWTSFRQLEDFVSEVRYSRHAALTKIAAIQSLLRGVWRSASKRAAGAQVSAADLEASLTLGTDPLAEGELGLPPELASEVGMSSLKDYTKSAEQWRVLLSLVFEEIRAPTGLKALDEDAEALLAKRALELSIVLLRRSGALARADDAQTIEPEHVREAMREIAERLSIDITPSHALPLTDEEAEARVQRLQRITGALIHRKAAALIAFNKGTGSVAGDLNAISKLPIGEDAVELLMADIGDFASVVTRGAQPMRADNYLNQGSFAPGEPEQAREGGVIDVVHAENVMMELFPHAVETNGDVVLHFEPNPGTVVPPDIGPQRVVLRDFQMNAVRDSAVHWLVLEALWGDDPFAMDPFALEYLSELLSVRLTYTLRRAQTEARQRKGTAVTARDAEAVHNPLYVMVPPPGDAAVAWGDVERAVKAAALADMATPVLVDVSGEREGWPRFSGAGRVKEALDIQDVMGAGMAVGDVNGDGYPDLYLSGEGLSRLLLNQGEDKPGHFVDVTEAMGLPQMDDGRGALFFDREGDGDLELLVLRSESESALFEQREGRFVDVAETLGFAPGKGAHVASIFDAEGDGDLDIYVGFYGADACHGEGGCEGRNLPAMDGRNGKANQLWVWDGTQYVEQGRRAGVADVGWTLATLAFDAEGDGDLDLYVANDFGANALLENRGGLSFVAMGAETGTDDRGSGMNASVTDVDGDGFWDIYVTNIDMFTKRIKVIFPTTETRLPLDEQVLRSFRYITGNKLYVRPDAGGRYRSEEQLRFEPGDRGWSWAGTFFDLENDGDEDMYLSNGWIPGSFAHNQANQLFVRAGERWYHAPAKWGGAMESDARSVVAADFDRDGDLDLAVNAFRQSPHMLENRQSKAHGWIGIQLEASGNNRDAIGARVTVITPDGRRQLRHVSCGTDYLGQGDTVLHVGLGKHAEATLEVRWPDGGTTRHEGLRGGDVHRISRGAAGGPR